MKKITLTIVLLFTSFFCFANDTEAPTTPTDLTPIFFNNNTGTAALLWTHSTDNIGVVEYDVYVDDVYNQTVAYNGNASHGDAVFSGIFGTTHCFKVLARDAAGNTSPLSNNSCFTRYLQILPNDLYISVIMNGTGANNLIAITNTIGPTNLDDYSIKISRDGNSTWQETYTFPSGLVIPDISSHIIANSQANACESGNYDEINDMITNFDGNDAIGLFKNDVLIDIVGTLGINNTNFESDKIYYRNSGFTSTTFDPLNWTGTVIPNTIACDEIEFIGSFTLLTVEEIETNAFQIYPNPTNGNSIYINTKNNVEVSSVRIYDLNGKQVLQTVNPSNEINIQGLKQGMYILQLEIGNQTINKKLIKQ
ncbi:T9SS type A sorting domain-containing protein [Kordia sp.]|uniref:T9SS type A sorting domain-containing protein n=1 Tax=Kordia sp. TaxID=1965332 RepID=UPI003B58C36C